MSLEPAEDVQKSAQDSEQERRHLADQIIDETPEPIPAPSEQKDSDKQDDPKPLKWKRLRRTEGGLLRGWKGLFRVRARRIDFGNLKSYERGLMELRFEDHLFDAKLKKWLGNGVLLILVVQIILMNLGFGYYAWIHVVERGKELADSVIITWLTISIVEVVGLATVVAKYLFPGDGSNWSHEPN